MEILQICINLFLWKQGTMLSIFLLLKINLHLLTQDNQLLLLLFAWWMIHFRFQILSWRLRAGLIPIRSQQFHYFFFQKLVWFSFDLRSFDLLIVLLCRRHRIEHSFAFVHCDNHTILFWTKLLLVRHATASTFVWSTVNRSLLIKIWNESSVLYVHRTHHRLKIDWLR